MNSSKKEESDKAAERAAKIDFNGDSPRGKKAISRKAWQYIAEDAKVDVDDDED